jgi:hypothetical protein
VQNLFAIPLELVLAGIVVSIPAEAINSNSTSDNVSVTSESHLKLTRWHDCVFNFACRAASDQTKDLILQTWKTFDRTKSPYSEIGFRVLPSGNIDEFNIRSEGSDVDNFFYVQAAYESAPISIQNKDLREPFPVGFNVSERRLTKGTRTRSNLVFVHIIPAGVLRIHPDLFSLKEIEDKNNCLTFDIKLANNPALQTFRTKWVEFWQEVPNPTKEQIVEKGVELEQSLKLKLKS